MSGRPIVVRRVVAALAVTASLLASAPGRDGGCPAAQPESIAAGPRYYPEVRLRKLHLVRPDLIPYPISFAVYC